jgi:hypothetical protein
VRHDDEIFHERITRAEIAATAVAGFLAGMGYETHVPPTRIRPTFEDRHAYSDGGRDVMIWRPGSALQSKIEVKWRGLDFTCAADYPFSTVNVDRAAKTDEHGAALFYVITNSGLTHAAFIMGNTRPHWLRQKGTDPNRGYQPYDIYRCPKHLCRFVAL